MGTSDGKVIGTTQIVDNGPASERWNLVILGDGYRSAELARFATDARGFADTLLATPPFDTLRAAINVFRVDVESTDSGADDPTACGGTGASPRTYFDAAFCNSGIRRLLVVNDRTVLTVADAQVPAWHVLIVIVNSTVYGGSGGQVAVYSLASGASEIALHELGHTAFGLADEYEYWAGCGVDTDRDHHPASEPTEPNVTIDTDRATLKWGSLILPATRVPTTRNADCRLCDPQPSPEPAGTVGLFEGAHYFHCDAFRPEFSCRMRALSNPFCAVCQDRIRTTLRPFLPAVRNPSLVQGRFGVQGNFELVVPLATGGLAHFWRNNDDPSFPWSPPIPFATGAGTVDAVSLIQSNFGSPGNLEVVGRIGDSLAHFWRESAPPFTWHGPFFFASGVAGTPSLIQGRFGVQGNFELVVPLATGGLAHFWRNNDDPSLPWSPPTPFGAGTVDAVSLIQSNFGSPGNLEVVGRIGASLAHFWRESAPPFTWHGPFFFASGVAGTPSLIQSRFGVQGNFELVVPLAAGGLAHFWRNNDDLTFPWSAPTPFAGSVGVAALSLIQSNFGSPGNLEVVARIGSSLAHFWRESAPPFPWHGPFTFA